MSAPAIERERAYADWQAAERAFATAAALSAPPVQRLRLNAARMMAYADYLRADRAQRSH